MKREPETVHVNPPMLKWLIGKLQEVPASLESADALEEGLLRLLTGTDDALLLQSGANDSSLLSESRICCGALTISAASRRVTRDGEEIFLTPKEFDLLYFLANHRGQVFTKEQIYRAVWDKDYLLDDSNIMAFIRKLRKKIEPAPDAPEYILTVWGIGYKFNERI